MPPELPPPVPSPLSLVELAHTPENNRWTHALTPALFALSWVVAFAAQAQAQSMYADTFLPLAAVMGCVVTLPIARNRRKRITARGAQGAYLALASLTPWLVFGLSVGPRLDADGGSGGALMTGPLLLSSLGLLMVLPITLLLLLRASVLAPRRWPLIASAVAVVGIALLSAVFSATHGDADALVHYEEVPVTLEATSAPGLFEHRVGYRDTLTQRRVGSRCVTWFENRYTGSSTALSHECASPVRLFSFDWSRGRTGWFKRPKYREQTFATSEEAVIGIGPVAPRYLLFAAPLWGWIAGALLGVFVGVVVWRRSRRAIDAWRAEPLRKATAQQGLARCDDGEVVMLPERIADYAGLVVVLGATAREAPFRGDPTRGATVFAGRERDWMQACDESESVAMSFALAVMWLPAAPLLAAPLLGMLSPM